MGRGLPDFAGWSGYPSIAGLSINPGIDVMGQLQTFVAQLLCFAPSNVSNFGISSIPHLERFMSDGWDKSSSAWISAMGDRGDFGREHILDPVMMERVTARLYERALDVGCGEGRFCRLLRANHVPVVGIDPTAALLAHARLRDPTGQYQAARAESLPFTA